MGILFNIFVLLVAAILEATFVPYIRLFGGGPDLIFLLVLSWAINSDLERGILLAFVGGILRDLLSAAPTGTSVLGLLLLVFAISGLGQRLFRIGLILLVGLVLIGTIVQQITVLVILRLNGLSFDPVTSFTYVIAPTMIYNLALIGPTYWLTRRTQKLIERNYSAP